MLHAQALVYSDDPSALGERIVVDLASTHPAEWAAEAGSVSAADGTCEFHSWPEGLRLDAFAETDAGLTAVEGVVTGAVARVVGASPAVEWYRRPSA